jgi:1-acyl-sn-glycerol-3-phosphate acyltransferase
LEDTKVTYSVLCLLAKLAMRFYTDQRQIVGLEDIDYNKATILASNHPNSFFDAIFIAVHYKKPLYFLARGDAFKNPAVASLLHSIHLIPIYRLSEGKENLSKNDATFETCLRLLKQKATILIFSEGICRNEWKLRSLKKGTSRLAWMAQNKNIETQIVPTVLTYSSFSAIPKSILLDFKKSFQNKSISHQTESEYHRNFNQILKGTLEENFVSVEKEEQVTLFKKKKVLSKKIALAIPSFLGWLTQKWFFNLVRTLALKNTRNTVFFDSVLFGLLLFLYPIFVITISFLIGLAMNIWVSLVIFFALPTFAYCYKSYKSI